MPQRSMASTRRSPTSSSSSVNSSQRPDSPAKCRDPPRVSSIAICSSNAILPCIDPSLRMPAARRERDLYGGLADPFIPDGRGVERRSASAGRRKTWNAARPPLRCGGQRSVEGKMDGKIGLEEHFAIADTLQDSAGFLPPEDWEELSGRLIDPEDRRLREMDAHGMEMMILSLNAPAIQAIPDLARAADIARRPTTTWRKGCPQAGPLPGLAALPLQDPELAAAELTRCIRDLGFVGALQTGSRRSRAMTRCSTTTCRNTGISGRSAPGSARPSISTRATRCPGTPESTRAIPG